MRTMRSSERVTLSFLNAREGGRSSEDARCELVDAGIPASVIKREHSVYIGHVAVSVPARYGAKASRILFGR